MISYLKFTFIFLFKVLKTNIVKTLLIIGAVLTFMYAGKFKPDVQEYNVASTVRVDSDYVYVCKTISENKIKYENVWSQSPIPVKDGKIYVSSYGFLNFGTDTFGPFRLPDTDLKKFSYATDKSSAAICKAIESTSRSHSFTSFSSVMSLLMS